MFVEHLTFLTCIPQTPNEEVKTKTRDPQVSLLLFSSWIQSFLQKQMPHSPCIPRSHSTLHSLWGSLYVKYISAKQTSHIKWYSTPTQTTTSWKMHLIPNAQILKCFIYPLLYLQKCRSSPGHLSPQVRQGAPAPISWAKQWGCRNEKYLLLYTFKDSIFTASCLDSSKEWTYPLTWQSTLHWHFPLHTQNSKLQIGTWNN